MVIKKEGYMIYLAKVEDLYLIMELIREAQQFLKDNNIPQWQNNYPNQETIKEDLKNKTLYLYWMEGIVAGMINISLKKDPQYAIIYDGAWLSNKDYAVIHRLAIKREFANLGIAQKLLIFSEELAKRNNIYSIKIDTHYLNKPMNSLLIKMGYYHCGTIELANHDQSDYHRLAYEKLL